MGLNKIFDELFLERQSQDKKWGEQNHPDGTGVSVLTESIRWDLLIARERYKEDFELGKHTWQEILNEEVLEAFNERNPAELRKELIQVAAVAIAWIEAIDRRAE